MLLLVAHTVRNEDEDEVIRIISARKASRMERIRYDQNRKKESLWQPDDRKAQASPGKAREAGRQRNRLFRYSGTYGKVLGKRCP